MTKAGPRVDLGKVGGLFRKRARPNHYLWISAVGLRSGGLDLMQLRSNLERRNQIGRPGLSGCGRRRRSTAGGPVRGGAALGSLEFADSGPPGSIRPRLGSERVSAPRVNHTRHQMGSGRPTTASATGGWICAAAHFADERGSQGPGTTDYQTQRQKNRGGLWVLTGGFWWPETSHRWVVGEVRR